MSVHDHAEPTEAGDSGGHAAAEPTLAADDAESGRASHQPVSVQPGRTLGRYVVLGRVGRGGMGTVLKAYDEALDRAIALKLLHSDAAERHAKRLTREAQALAKLSHPNVVHVYEVGQADGQWYLTMELVHGDTLRQWQSRRRDWRDVVGVYLQAGEGLRAAHAAGLVHRDFKPDNCIIDETGRPKVVDFGLVRETGTTDGDGEEPSAGSITNDDENATAPLTVAGAVLGTVAYMPLEQLSGQPVDARSDQFSFCVSLYEALYGERPFAQASTGELTAALMSSAVRPVPRGIHVPGRLRRILVRGLAAEPDQRWPSMEALLGELRRVVAPRRLGVPLLLGTAAVTLALGVALWPPKATNEEPCQGAREQLTGVWDDERSARVRDAILGTEVSYAEQTWTRIEPALDEYAEAWVAAHTDACLATSVRKEQSTEVLDLRMACLQRQRLELRETVGVLTEANPTRVQRAVQLVSKLPSASRCEDIEMLRADHPPPEDPEVARAVELLRERLVSASSLVGAGEYEQCRERLETIVTEAEAIGYGPLTVEAWELRGDLREKLGDYEGAVEDQERAHLLAAELDLRRLEVRTASHLTFLLGGRKADPERALWWGRLSVAQSKGLPEGTPVRAYVLNNLGTAYKNRGELDEALRYYRRALATMEAAGPPRESDLAGVLNNMGLVLQERHELDEARHSLERALSIRRRTLGDGHPMVAGAWNNLGSVLHEQGDQDAALDHYLRALAIWEESLGPSHPHVFGTRLNIGNLQRGLGALDDAEENLRRALSGFEQALGPEHPRYAWALTEYASVLEAQGEQDAALERYERALAILEEARGPDHGDVALVLQHLGVTLSNRGDTERARDHLERALTIREQTLGPDHPVVATTRVSLAIIALETGAPAVAREHAQRAVAILEPSDVPPRRLAEARAVLGEALWADPSQRSHAHRLVSEAADVLTEANGPDASARARAEAWLKAHPLKTP